MFYPGKAQIKPKLIPRLSSPIPYNMSKLTATYFGLHRKPFLFPGNNKRTLMSPTKLQSRMGGKNNGYRNKAPRNFFSSCKGDAQGPKVVLTMKQILSVPRQPFYWDSLLVTIETRSQLISNRELHALAKSKPTPLPGAVQKPCWQQQSWQSVSYEDAVGLLRLNPIYFIISVFFSLAAHGCSVIF